MSANTNKSRKTMPRGGWRGNNHRPRVGVDGSLFIDGNMLRIKCAYSEERVATIKKIKGYRYNSDDHSWKIPLLTPEAKALIKNPLFNGIAFYHYFNHELLSLTVSELGLILKEAQQALVASPLAVPHEHFTLLPVDVGFIGGTDPQGVRARVRYGSKALSLITHLDGAHFVPTEGLYLIPTQEMTGLITALREAQLSWCVEKELSAVLSSTSAERASLLSEQTALTAERAHQAMLFPVIEKRGGAYVLHGTTQIQRRELIDPEVAPTSRKRACSALSLEHTSRCLARASTVHMRVFCTPEVTSDIAAYHGKVFEQYSSSDGLSDDIVFAESTPLCWFVTSKLELGLLGSKEEIQKIRTLAPLKDTPGLRTKKIAHKVFLPVPDELYEEVTHLHYDGEIRKSRGAIAFETRRLEQLERLKMHRYYTSCTDADLSPYPCTDPQVYSKLFPHQRVAVRFLLDLDHALLGDDMGLGKTLSVLTTFDILRAQKKVDFLLVLSPNSLTRTWKRESERWFPQRPWAAIPQSKEERILLLQGIRDNTSNYEGLSINFESVRLPYVLPVLEKLCKSKRVFLVIDESQRIKNPASRTFASVKSFAPDAHKRVLLSGTPTPKELSDIWAQMFLLDGGNRLGDSYHRWLESVAELGNEFSDFAVRKYTPEGIRSTITKVQEVLLRRRKDRVTTLPPKIFTVRDVELTGDQAERYDEVREQLLLRVSSLTGESFTREITSVLEEYLRAVQIASNPRLIDELWKGEPGKFVELDEIVEELVHQNDEKIVVWTNFVKNIDELTLRYARYGALPFSGAVKTDTRENTIKQFQDPSSSCRILVAIPAAGGVGITLTAAKTAVYVDKTWNGEHWLQSIDRIHRIGQTGTVQIISLSAAGVDDLINRNLTRKEEMLKELLGDSTSRYDAMKKLLPTRAEMVHALTQNTRTAAINSI
jgi:hypothetical protein